jgi:hypothetical protein
VFENPVGTISKKQQSQGGMRMFRNIWNWIPSWIYSLFAVLLFVGGVATTIFFNDNGPADGGWLLLIGCLASGTGVVILWDIHDRRKTEKKT